MCKMSKIKSLQFFQKQRFLTIYVEESKNSVAALSSELCEGKLHQYHLSKQIS